MPRRTNDRMPWGDRDMGLVEFPDYDDECGVDMDADDRPMSRYTHRTPTTDFQDRPVITGDAEKISEPTLDEGVPYVSRLFTRHD